MVAQPSIPRPTERLVDFSGLPTPLWYAFLNRAQTVSNDTTALQAEVVALDARVDALEAGGASFSILGQQSVQVLGTPAGGLVSLQLDGDVIDPGFTMRYGTDTTGAKGWFAESDAFLVVAGELTKAVGSDGLTTYGLADLADAGGGTFRLIVRDAKGRVSGSSAGTTDNVPEGATNLYYTAARVRGTALTGLSTATGGAITASDTVLSAFGKLQNQVTGLPASILAANNTWTGSNTWTGAVTGVQQVDTLPSSGGSPAWVKIASMPWVGSGNSSLQIDTGTNDYGNRRTPHDFITVSTRNFSSTTTALTQTIVDQMVEHMRLCLADNLTAAQALQIGLVLTVDGGGVSTGVDVYARLGQFNSSHSVRLLRSIQSGYLGRTWNAGSIITIEPAGIVYATVRQVYNSGNAVAYTGLSFTLSGNNRLLGRATAGAGAAEELTLGTALSFSGGALTLSAPLLAINTAGTAPADSKTYGLNNGAWTQAISDAPSDGSTYGRKDGAWVVVTGGGGGGGTVTSVSGSGGTTGLTLTGGPITGSGTLTLGGTLAIANGGTGATTAAAARTALGVAPTGAITASGLTMATARILGRTTASTGAAEEITIGSGLTLSGGTLTGTGGTVTSVAVSGGTTGLTTSGGPITGAGTITLAGTLAVANGGTGATTAAGARTGLGATTVGGNLFTLANPSAIAFLRVNADNTVSALDAATFRTAIGAGTGGGSVTSVAVTGSTGLTVGGSPITTTGTITLTLSANLQSWSGIAPSSKADVSALANYVLKAGDTMTGALTATQFTSANGNFQSATASVVIGPTGAGMVYLRPNGPGSATGQATVGVSGDLLAAGNVSSGSGNLTSTTGSVVVAPTGAGMVYLRPNGAGSATGQATISSAGDLSVASGKILGGGDVNHYIDVGLGGTNRMELGSFFGLYNFYNTSASATEIQFDAGSIKMTKANTEFSRSAANSTTLTRQPRIFVGGSDPGAAAADGDIWIP